MNELSKKIMCVQMRTGVEIWMEGDRATKLQEILERITTHKFINFDDQTINSADIVGVFTGNTMEEATRRKNGQHQCKSGKWHDRGCKCDCPPLDVVQKIKAREEAVLKCGKCKNGYIVIDQITEEGSIRPFISLCDCVKGL